MNEASYGKSSNFTELAVDLVAAYVANNPVPATELPALIARVYGAIASLASGTAPVESGASAPVAVDKLSPAQIRKSVQQDGIVSFLDGKTYKTLKRHLAANGLSPQSYRERYGLPSDYPMVAPSYAEQRSALAKAIGLGQPGSMAKRKGKAA
ncbi:MucR family transcriptional regulator [Methylobacterium pseudosasicola]|uniref:Transcriptional regulator, MucR family n=1 Tax=Methylobacterium pseudosasicola TaxID=582667 RepID=A0A1I4NP79_9HYPH|nr:MucR family transcriptional regulator [Methylobacterium pseudosasicola]SFM17269.1 transcriptional regulator, MucR family [Methylobacterium pseudosasicola]